MKILVVGAGATGGYFGGRLAVAGHDVAFFVRPPRGEQLRRTGLNIISPFGNLTTAPQLLLEQDRAGLFDLVIIALKAYSLRDVLPKIAPSIGPSTIILPLLNGIQHLDILTECFSLSQVIGGICHIGVTLDHDGTIRHLGTEHCLSFGELNGAYSEQVHNLNKQMHGAGFESRVSAEILQEMWDKWVSIASLAGLTCLVRGNIGEIASVELGRDLVSMFLNECVEIAGACGFPPSKKIIDRIFNVSVRGPTCSGLASSRRIC